MRLKLLTREVTLLWALCAGDGLVHCVRRSLHSKRKQPSATCPEDIKVTGVAIKSQRRRKEETTRRPTKGREQEATPRGQEGIHKRKRLSRTLETPHKEWRMQTNKRDKCGAAKRKPRDGQLTFTVKRP